MAKVTPSNSAEAYSKMRPSLTPEDKDKRMISLAYDLVERRMLEGTASSQETTHFLKLATAKARLENQLLEAQTAMAIAKKESLESQKRTEEMFAEAIKAFRQYSGQDESDGR